MLSLGTTVESLMSYMHTVAVNMHCSYLHLQEVQWTDSLWIHHYVYTKAIFPTSYSQPTTEDG